MATEQTLDTVNNTNLKTVGEAASFAQAQSMQNMVAHTNRMNIIAEAATAKCAEMLATTDISEAGAMVPLLQQLIKGAQTTLPETGQGT